MSGYYGTYSGMNTTVYGHHTSTFSTYYAGYLGLGSSYTSSGYVSPYYSYGSSSYHGYGTSSYYGYGSSYYGYGSSYYGYGSTT